MQEFFFVFRFVVLYLAEYVVCASYFKIKVLFVDVEVVRARARLLHVYVYFKLYLFCFIGFCE